MTATQLQFRRGTAAQLATFAGAPGEVVVDTTNNRIVVCDGSTGGGFPAAKLSEVPSLLSYQGSGFVNRFRNGNFDVAQRGTSGTVATSGGYAVDGWIVVPTGASLNWQQGAPGGTGGVSPPTGSNYFLYLGGAAGMTDVTVKQRIEGSVAAPLAGKQVTVQLAIYGGLPSPPVPALTVKHANALDNWSGATTDVNAVALQGLTPNQWRIQSYTFTAPSAAGNGLEISWDLGALTSNAVALGQADIRATPGVATGLNSSPPLPELRPIGVELVLCQRHLYVVTAQGMTNAVMGEVGIALGTTQIIAAARLPSMRAIPSLTVSAAGDFTNLNSGGAFSANAFSNASLGTATTSERAFLIFGGSAGTGLSNGMAAFLISANSNAKLIFSAEL